MNKRQLREVKRAEKEETQGCDVRVEANVRPAIAGSRQDALADAIFRVSECPCGLGAEPWHWPRHGICTVGASKR